MPYVMVISIGPVQGFIASARRTGDLRYGSWLLSELAKVVAKSLDAEGHTLVFPAGDLDHIPGVPNKLVAVIKHGDPAEIAEELEAKLAEKLRDLYTPVLDKLPKPQQELAIAQIESLPHFYWAAAAYAPEQPAGYAAARTRAEALLAARKNTRDFAPVTWGANVPKSSITGDMESVLPNPAPNDPAAADTRWQDYRAGANEHLSGVDLLKRNGTIEEVNQGFPSTSHMAAKPFMQHVQKAFDADTTKFGELQKWWMCYIAKVPPDIGEYEAKEFSFFGANDGALLFEERLSVHARERQEKDEAEKKTSSELQASLNCDPLTEPQAKSVKAALPRLQAFLEEARKLGLGSPDPYYAILLGDGDSMGKVIDTLAQHGYEQHQALSHALDKFVGRAQEIITDHSGAPIYIGGDDVLALLPLHTVVQCADLVAQAFADELAKVGQGLEPPPSLSAGIAIVHHLMPLSDALDLARGTEKIAKQVKGKDALAITLSRRSGGDYTVQAQRAELVERLKLFIKQFAFGKLPSGVAYEIRDLVLRLNLASTEGANIPPAAREDTIRILGRKRTAGGELLDTTTKAALREIVNAPSVSLLELAYELVVARALADAGHPSDWEATKASNV